MNIELREQEICELNESKTGKSISKDSNLSKASVDCIKHLTSQLNLLKNENLQLKQEISNLNLQIETLKKEKIQVNNKLLTDKLINHIKKIDNMNQGLKRKIEDFQNNLLVQNQEKCNISLKGGRFVQDLLIRTQNTGPNEKIFEYKHKINKITEENRNLKQKKRVLTHENEILSEKCKILTSIPEVPRSIPQNPNAVNL